MGRTLSISRRCCCWVLLLLLLLLCVSTHTQSQVWRSERLWSWFLLSTFTWVLRVRLGHQLSTASANGRKDISLFLKKILDGSTLIVTGGTVHSTSGRFDPSLYVFPSLRARRPGTSNPSAPLNCAFWPQGSASLKVRPGISAFRGAFPFSC